MSIGKTDKQPEPDEVERVKLRYIRFGGLHFKERYRAVILAT